MPHLLIVGQKFSSLTTYLLEHGYTYTLLQDVLKTKFPDKKFKNRVVADFSDPALYLSTVDGINIPIDGVITTYENYVLPTAIIAKHLGLPGMSEEAAEACTDKFLMRSLFEKATEKISPSFAIITSEEDVKEFAKNHRFPLIMKPANLAKSLLVTKNADLEELLSNYHRSVELLQTTYRKFAPNRQPKLIIEEFLVGSIHSVDAFVNASGEPYVLDAVVDYQTGYDIGYDDNFHYSRILPSTLSPSDQQALRHAAEVGVKALKMTSSPAHIEIIMTEQGPRIVEIGARNGGYRERMHALANGIDITGAAISLALHKPVAAVSQKNEPCAVLELFPKTPGLFTGISHFEELSQLASLSYMSVKAKDRAFVGKAGDGYKMCAVVILHHKDAAQFASDLAYINTNCHVTTE